MRLRSDNVFIRIMKPGKIFQLILMSDFYPMPSVRSGSVNRKNILYQYYFKKKFIKKQLLKKQQINENIIVKMNSI